MGEYPSHAPPLPTQLASPMIGASVLASADVGPKLQGPDDLLNFMQKQSQAFS